MEDSSMPEPIVDIRNITKSYHRDSIEIPVLQNLSCTIPEGEFLALMGNRRDPEKQRC